MSRTSLTVIFACASLLLTGQPARAQADLKAIVLKQLTTSRDFTLKVADQMPETDYGFRPVNTVRTFGEILAHVAGANYVFCAAAKGEPAPHAEAAFEKTATTRAQIIKVLAESVAYCDAAYAALDDKRAGEIVDLPFGMGKGARALPLMINSGHVQEHYGNLVTYFRVKGMVPPSSQGQ